MRIGVVGCYHETNTFAPGITPLDDFQKEWYIGKQSFYQAFQGTKTSMGGVIDASETFNFELVPLFYTQTLPSSTVSEDAKNAIIKEIIHQVRKEQESLDGLLVILHGAMASEKCQDVEGELLRLLKEVVESKPISVTIDLHANLSEDMVRIPSFIVGYDTYPHIDAYERAIEATELLIKYITNQVKPTSHLERTNLLIAPTLMNTNIEPMSTLMARVFKYEKEADVLTISIVGGFAFADVFCVGANVLVTTNDNPQKAERIACELSQWMRLHQNEFRPVLYNLEQAKEYANQQTDFPIVFIESSDNVGAGTPADATHTLRYLIEHEMNEFLIVIHDYEAVNLAFAIGVGGELDYPIGGKKDIKDNKDPLHGRPVNVFGKIKLLSDGVYRHRGPYMTGMLANMGKTAVIEIEDNKSSIILTEKRVAPWDINHLKSVEVDPIDFKIIVVKAAVAWRSAFGDIAKYAIELDTPGSSSSNLNYFEYKNIPESLEVIAGGSGK
ncbi:M81 family metallopeptidase [Bacillus sp. 1P02SD]|uniref:M81 family metallopeptidase n=1 Tax=Bacillus sp. 1P02SD TaxID=3132264 RepID=UPI0039A38978